MRRLIGPLESASGGARADKVGGVTMADEVKQTEKKGESKNMAATLLKVAIGLMLLVLGGWALLVWWSFLIALIKGSIGLFLILAGIITLAIAKE